MRKTNITKKGRPKSCAKFCIVFFSVRHLPILGSEQEVENPGFPNKSCFYRTNKSLKNSDRITYMKIYKVS